MNPRTAAACAAVFMVAIIDTAYSQDERAAELQVLNRYVGTWLHEVTLLPSQFTPEKTTQRVTELTEWTLNDSFIMGREVNATNGTKSLWFLTVNRNDKTTYPFWYVDSRGIIGLWNGEWDESSKAMAFTATDLPPGWKGVAIHKFSADSFVSAMTITNDSGQKVLDIRDAKKRQPGIAGKRTLETWAKVDTPSSPVPEEVKRLEPLIGEWDAEYVFRLPQRRKEKGVIKDEWALDGRFVLRRETVGDTHSIAMIGYDTNKKAYRLVRAVSNGSTNELIGEWDEKTRSIIWRAADLPQDVESISTWRFIGSDAVQIHVVREADSGVTLDLTIKIERRKKK